MAEYAICFSLNIIYLKYKFSFSGYIKKSKFIVFSITFLDYILALLIYPEGDFIKNIGVIDVHCIM